MAQVHYIPTLLNKQADAPKYYAVKILGHTTVSAIKLHNALYLHSFLKLARLVLKNWQTGATEGRHS